MLQQLKQILQRYGLHTFLLPVFFILHNYLLYYGLASGITVLWLLLKTELIFAGCFLLLLAISRQAGKSLQLTTLLGFIVLFYGVFKDFFDDTLHVHVLARYIVLLPLLLLLTLVAGVWMWRKKDRGKLNFFQNTLLLLFILADGAQLLRLNSDSYFRHNLLVKNNLLNPDTLAAPAEKPDVYFLVFDSYPGNAFQRDYLQHDNTSFDTALQQRGFHIIPHPKSNYNRTQFSIACTLNFEYLRGVSPHAEARYYNLAIMTTKHAVVPRIFMHYGYRLYNLSIFDWADQRALMKENFLTLPETQMLLYNTLPERYSQDIKWNFLWLYRYLPFQEKRELLTKNQAEEIPLRIKRFNTIAIDTMLKIPSLPAAGPKFVYAHFYLPHIPLSYDSNGKPAGIRTDNSPAARKAAVVSYLKYTNKTILSIVDSILRNARRPPVIIVQSDHGYRDLGKDIVPEWRYYDNYSAFFFPGKNYTALYDSMSNINSFPALLNTCFNTHIPMQKDSCAILPFP